MCIYGRANTHTGGYEFMKVDFNEMEIIMIKQVMTMILAFFPPFPPETEIYRHAKHICKKIEDSDNA